MSFKLNGESAQLDSLNDENVCNHTIPASVKFQDKSYPVTDIVDYAF